MKDRRDKIAKVQMRSDDGKENKDDVLKEAWDLTKVIYYQVNLSLSLSQSLSKSTFKKLLCFPITS